jgi:hypothetical protein
MSNVVEIAVKSKDMTKAGFASADRSASSLGSKMGKLGKAAAFGAAGVAVGAVVAGKALFDMGKAAMEDEKAQVLLAKQLRNSAKATDGQVKATESWISAQGRALGVTDDELRPALSRLVVATKDVDKAQRLASLAMDIAAAKGKPLKTVSEALAKAQEGNIGALGRLGIKTKDASGKTRELSDITKELARTYEGSASTAANTTAGKFGRLKLIFDETKESIGAKLIPVATKLADWAFKMAPTVAKLGDTLAKNLGPPLAAIGGFLKDRFIPAVKDLAGNVLEGLRGMFKNVGKSMEDNKPFLAALAEGLKKLAGFIVSKVYPALGWIFKTALPALGTGIGIAITVLRKMSSGFLGLAIIGVKSFRFLLNAAFSTFGGILSAAEKGLGWIKGIGGKIRSAKEAFDNFKDKTVANLDKTAAALQRTKDKIDGIKSKAVTIKVTTTFFNSGSMFDLPKKKAHGGIGGGLTMVGERGRELVRLPQGSTVIPNGTTESMLAGGGGGRAVIEIRSSGSRVDDMLLELLRNAVKVRGGNVQLVLGR